MKGLSIDYMLDEICGLPGPNLYFHGDALAFERLSYVIQDFLQGKSHRCNLSDLPWVAVSPKDLKVVFKRSDVGGILSKKVNNEILMDLSIDYWEKLFIWAVIMSRGEGSTTTFIEFEGQELVEELNVIWEC